jgi:hypothetical protein
MSRAPDFILKALNKRTDAKSGKIGCAWANADGSLTVQLDMMVSLQYDADLVLTLFPNDAARPVSAGPIAPVPFPWPAAKPPPAPKPAPRMDDLPRSVRHRLKD